jgi:hypothetical protein
MKLVVVDWIDACTINLGQAWSDIEDLRQDAKQNSCECRNVGWVIHEDKKQIVLVSSLQKNSEDSEFERAAQTFAIPKQWCIKITELTEVIEKQKNVSK